MAHRKQWTTDDKAQWQAQTEERTAELMQQLEAGVQAGGGGYTASMNWGTVWPLPAGEARTRSTIAGATFTRLMCPMH